ncbi:guanine nucleotide-binding protein G(s) subunit alpha isoforms XLas-like [Bacillus rossius redtenbacheri]|uniref:guanine nucleotide-binding protein G(s) subunit alpha isoforms XLas-like n=1 Tax=Bacillus rossius redtenbacheri TaxID=93214 RepID=UPI002FDDF402
MVKVGGRRTQKIHRDDLWLAAALGDPPPDEPEHNNIAGSPATEPDVLSSEVTPGAAASNEPNHTNSASHTAAGHDALSPNMPPPCSEVSGREHSSPQAGSTADHATPQRQRRNRQGPPRLRITEVTSPVLGDPSEGPPDAAPIVTEPDEPQSEGASGPRRRRRRPERRRRAPAHLADYDLAILIAPCAAAAPTGPAAPAAAEAVPARATTPCAAAPPAGPAAPAAAEAASARATAPLQPCIQVLYLPNVTTWRRGLTGQNRASLVVGGAFDVVPTLPSAGSHPISDPPVRSAPQPDPERVK